LSLKRALDLGAVVVHTCNLSTQQDPVSKEKKKKSGVFAVHRAVRRGNKLNLEAISGQCLRWVSRTQTQGEGLHESVLKGLL
jgi:hypothetical protein